MCACVVYGCVLASGYVSQIMGVWRAEVYVSCVSLSLSTPLCETGSLELADWLGWLAVYHGDPSVAAFPALESGVYHHTRIWTWVLGIPLRFSCIHIKHFTHWANPSVIKIIYTHVHNHIHNIYMYIHTYKMYLCIDCFLIKLSYRSGGLKIYLDWQTSRYSWSTYFQIKKYL